MCDLQNGNEKPWACKIVQVCNSINRKHI